MKLHQLLKPKEGKRFKIEHFIVSNEAVRRMKLRDSINRTNEYLNFEAGTYVRLCDKTLRENRGVMMSNTWMEKETNKQFIKNAHGDVIIAGLGLGIIILAIQNNQKVESITVIEKHKEIIDLVAPQLPFNKKVKIINADIFEWQPNGYKFDTIYFDIWNNITEDNYPEMKQLHRKFFKKLNEDNLLSWMSSWREEDCKRLAEE